MDGWIEEGKKTRKKKADAQLAKKQVFFKGWGGDFLKEAKQEYANKIHTI